MIPIRIVTIPNEVLEKVRRTMRALFRGFPLMPSWRPTMLHCLRAFVAGGDRRILFTYDRVAGVEALPQPGPTSSWGGSR